MWSDPNLASSSDVNGSSIRRWQDMDKDCLVNIFSRVPTLDLVQSIPLVCKTWQAASLVPKSWARLDFQRTRTSYETFYPFSSEFLKLAVSRSQGRATAILMPFPDFFEDIFRPEDLDFIAGALEGLRFLACGRVTEKANQVRLAEVIDKWADLEGLSIGGEQPELAKMLAAAARGCPRFHQLHLFGMCLDHEAAAVLAEHLGPRLTYLSLSNVFTAKDDLLLVLRSCNNLRQLHIKDCRGFPRNDADIMEFGARIQKFIYKPFVSRYEDEEWVDGISTSDVYDGNSDDGYEP